MTDKEIIDLFFSKITDDQTNEILSPKENNTIKCVITSLENKKREVENKFFLQQTPDVIKGYIIGLNYAIDVLYDKINPVKS